MSERNQNVATEGQFDPDGKLPPRALAEMIISSLYYAKPPAISKADYDRAVNIAEEEISVWETIGKDWAARNRNRK